MTTKRRLTQREAIAALPPHLQAERLRWLRENTERENELRRALYPTMPLIEDGEQDEDDNG